MERVHWGAHHSSHTAAAPKQEMGGRFHARVNGETGHLPKTHCQPAFQDILQLVDIYDRRNWPLLALACAIQLTSHWNGCWFPLAGGWLKDCIICYGLEPKLSHKWFPSLSNLLGSKASKPSLGPRVFPFGTNWKFLARCSERTNIGGWESSSLHMCFLMKQMVSFGDGWPRKDPASIVACNAAGTSQGSCNDDGTGGRQGIR